MPRMPTPDGPGKTRTVYLDAATDKLMEERAKSLDTSVGKLLNALAKAYCYGSVSEESVKQEL